MSKKALAIAGRTEGSRLPTFEVHQLRSASRWYVRVLWQYGQEQHIAGFVSADAAQSWIIKKSQRWLQNRTAALQSHDNQKGLCERFGGDQKCKITVHHGKNEMATS